VQFRGGSGEGCVDVGGFGRDDEGAMAFGAGFEEAAFVSGFGLGSGFPGAGLFVGFPSEVDLDAGEVGVESVKDVEDVGSDGIGELVVHRDRAVTVDLNLHGLSLCYLSTKTLVTRTEWPENKGVLPGIFFWLPAEIAAAQAIAG
jgi:hypothetical protein